MTSTMKNILSN